MPKTWRELLIVPILSKRNKVILSYGASFFGYQHEIDFLVGGGYDGSMRFSIPSPRTNHEIYRFTEAAKANIYTSNKSERDSIISKFPI